MRHILISVSLLLGCAPCPTPSQPSPCERDVDCVELDHKCILGICTPCIVVSVQCSADGGPQRCIIDQCSTPPFEECFTEPQAGLSCK